MASNVVQTPTPISLNQAEKFVASSAYGERSATASPAGPAVNPANWSLATMAAAQLNLDLVQDITLTAAQVNALTQSGATSLIVMGAPALIPTVGNGTTQVITTNTNPGYAIMIDRVAAVQSQTGTVFTVNGCTGLSLQINSVEQCRLPVTGLIDTQGGFAAAGLVSPASVGPLIAPNTAVRLVALTASPTGGSGTLSLRFHYALVPANW